MAIAVEFAMTLAALFVEHQYFVALYERFYNFADYFCAFYGGRAYGDCAFVVNEEDFFKFNSLAFLCCGDVVHEESFAFFSLELLTVNLYDCVQYYII